MHPLNSKLFSEKFAEYYGHKSHCNLQSMMLESHNVCLLSTCMYLSISKHYYATLVQYCLFHFSVLYHHPIHPS